MFLTAALSANAQATRMSLGYVNGQMKTSGTDGFSTNTKDTWFPVPSISLQIKFVFMPAITSIPSMLVWLHASTLTHYASGCAQV